MRSLAISSSSLWVDNSSNSSKLRKMSPATRRGTSRLIAKVDLLTFPLLSATVINPH